MKNIAHSCVCVCLCVSAVLLLGIFLYTRWRSYKGLKEGVYHVSAHHDGWEDIRENVLNYDEEGGGEEDQVNASSMTARLKLLTMQRLVNDCESVHFFSAYHAIARMLKLDISGSCRYDNLRWDVQKV